MQNFSRLFALLFVLAFVTFAQAQPRPYSEAKWKRYTIEKTGLSVELPSSPTKVGLGDLPDWFKSQVDGDLAASMSKIGGLEVEISAWTFKNNFDGDIAMTGLAGGAGISDGKFKLEFSQDWTDPQQKNSEPQQKTIMFEGELIVQKSERKGIVIARGQKAWLIQTEYPRDDSEGRAAALRIIRSMRLD